MAARDRAGPPGWAERWRVGRWRDAQTWRLASGLVLFAFVLTHYLNHALGLVSLEAMEDAQVLRTAAWRSWPGTILLYGAFAAHIGFALAKLVTRRTWRMPPWEAAQVGLGLAIPFLLVGHIVANRGLSVVADYEDWYRNTLRQLWPHAVWRQSLLLLIVWLHGTIGLHHWLGTRAWYARWAPTLLVAAVIVPTLALTGWIEGARRAAMMGFGPPETEEQARLHDLLRDRADAAL